MLLSEYQTQIICVIDHYARTNLITSSEIVLDARSPKIGVLKRSIEFIDGMQLFLQNMWTAVTVLKSLITLTTAKIQMVH